MSPVAARRGRTPQAVRPTHCLGPCGRPLLASNYRGHAPDGWARHGGFGKCTACYQRGLRTNHPTEAVSAEPTGLRLVDTTDRFDYFSAAPNVTPATAYAAARQVCAHAINPTDARELLERLGLLEAAPAARPDASLGTGIGATA